MPHHEMPVAATFDRAGELGARDELAVRGGPTRTIAQPGISA